ncbi:MAG: hypothetical protein E7428_06565 [Ruminococcaceae bacterium]|nr:hypothetical protein [Oscillospiraceae bacterium]
MKKIQMILGICLFALVLLFTGCEGAEEVTPETQPVESEELLPESQVEEPESESETEFVLVDQAVYHGVPGAWDEYWADAPEKEIKAAQRFGQFRICKTLQEYESYIAMLREIRPDADMHSFPEIPNEWFLEHSLVTLSLDGIDVGGDFRVYDRWSNGKVMIITLEAQSEKIQIGDWVGYDRATFLTSVSREEGDALEAIYYAVIHTDAELDGQIRNDIELVRESNTQVLEQVELAKEGLTKGILLEEVEASYRRAVGYARGSDAKSEAWLDWDEDGNLISDGKHEDIPFAVFLQGPPADGIFPKVSPMDSGWVDRENEAWWDILNDNGISVVSWDDLAFTRAWKKNRLIYDVEKGGWIQTEEDSELYTKDSWREFVRGAQVSTVADAEYTYIPCSVETLRLLLETEDVWMIHGTMFGFRSLHLYPRTTYDHWTYEFDSE